MATAAPAGARWGPWVLQHTDGSCSTSFRLQHIWCSAHKGAYLPVLSLLHHTNPSLLVC